MKTVISKGYTITVVSWENDADNYRTKSLTVESRNLAIAIARLCTTVFKSCNNGEGGIGNMVSEGTRDNPNPVIIPYMRENPDLYPGQSNLTDDKLISICMDYNWKLLGGSEWYHSRICESCTIVYSPTDIELEEIQF